jgi:hypothetical protein
MSLLISEQILEDVTATLEAVRTVAGYENTYDVDRPSAVVNPWADLGMVVVMGDPSPVALGEGGACLGYQTWDLPISVTVGVITAEADTDLPETRKNAVAADVYRALLEDETRGGLALWTTPEPLSKDENGVVVPFTIRYRHLWGNPYAAS